MPAVQRVCASGLGGVTRSTRLDIPRRLDSPPKSVSRCDDIDLVPSYSTAVLARVILVPSQTLRSWRARRSPAVAKLRAAGHAVHRVVLPLRMRDDGDVAVFPGSPDTLPTSTSASPNTGGRSQQRKGPRSGPEPRVYRLRTVSNGVVRIFYEWIETRTFCGMWDPALILTQETG